MLPFDNNRKIPTIIGSDDTGDLMEAAVTRCMTRLINAIGSQDVSQAVAAWKDLQDLGDCD